MLLFGIRLLIERRELSRKSRTTCYNHDCIDASGHQCGYHHFDISELGNGSRCRSNCCSRCPHNGSNSLKTRNSYFHSHSRYCSQQPIVHKQRNLYGHLHRPIWRRNILGLRGSLIVSQLYQQRDGHRCRLRCQFGSCAIGSASSSFLEEGSSTRSKLSCPCSCPCHAE